MNLIAEALAHHLTDEACTDVLYRLAAALEDARASEAAATGSWAGVCRARADAVEALIAEVQAVR